jgi:hypothetical protein
MEKISVNKSTEIYKALVRVLGISDDHYEKEIFIYHHSICNHDIKDYNLCSSNIANWSFSIHDNIEKVKLVSYDKDIFHENNDIIRLNEITKKVNKIIDYKIKYTD